MKKRPGLAHVFLKNSINIVRGRGKSVSARQKAIFASHKKFSFS